MRPLAQYGIAIKCIDRIQTSPTAGKLQLVKGWDVLDQFWPQMILEYLLPPGEVKSDGIVGQNLAGHERASFFLN